MNIKKKILIILTLCMFCITIYKIAETYALFESQVTVGVKPSVGRWNIFINESEITNGTTEEFIMDTFKIDESQYTEENKVAPGMGGKFEIGIYPKNTQVSIRYDVTIDDSNLEGYKISLLSIKEISSGNELIKTGPSTYTGVILLEEISEEYADVIEVEFVWENDETYNEQDTAVGTVYNSSIAIPIALNVSQYLGETIEEYNEVIEEENVENEENEEIT